MWLIRKAGVERYSCPMIIIKRVDECVAHTLHVGELLWRHTGGCTKAAAKLSVAHTVRSREIRHQDIAAVRDQPVNGSSHDWVSTGQST